MSAISAEQAKDLILASRLVAILRLDDGGRAPGIADELVEAGVRAIEVTMETPGAAEALATLSARWPGEVAIGAGTVLTLDDLEAARRAGASFIVSPEVNRSVIEAARSAGLLVVPGALTATEVLRAWRAGAQMVKVFPAGPVGPGYLRALRGPLPGIPLVPTGGIEIEEIPGYLTAGAAAVAIGSCLVPRSGERNGLFERARRAEQLASRSPSQASSSR